MKVRSHIFTTADTNSHHCNAKLKVAYELSELSLMQSIAKNLKTQI